MATAYWWMFRRSGSEGLMENGVAWRTTAVLQDAISFGQADAPDIVSEMIAPALTRDELQK